MAVSANRLELLQIADAVAREKSIDRMIVIEAMEDAIQKAARSRYGAENDIRAKIDPKTGEIRCGGCSRSSRPSRTSSTRSPSARRVNATRRRSRATSSSIRCRRSTSAASPRRSAKQVIFQKVRDAERERQYEEFKDRVGEIINGVVKRVEFGHVIVDLGRAEGVIRRDEQIPRESLPRRRPRPRLHLRRAPREPRPADLPVAHPPEFMTKLFAQEVPEIYDGIIEIKAAARDPGSRAKIARDPPRHLDRPGRRLRRHARQPRAGRGEGAAGREDRHHSLDRGHRDLRRQRAAAGRGRRS